MHRDFFYCGKTQEGYKELYDSLKENKEYFDLEWLTWQLSDDRFFTKEQAFDILYYFINRYKEENAIPLKIDFDDNIVKMKNEQKMYIVKNAENTILNDGIPHIWNNYETAQSYADEINEVYEYDGGDSYIVKKVELVVKG